MTTLVAPRQSSVLDTPAAEPSAAAAHFALKLACETDPSDVHSDLAKGVTGIAVVDCRSPESYAKGHIPGALNLPHRTITQETAARIPAGATIITYCSNITCNASTKGALRFAQLGFRVKEMVGGFEAWSKKGYPVAGGTAPGTFGAPLVLN